MRQLITDIDKHEIWDSESYVMNIADFNINIHFFFDYPIISQNDEDFLLFRTIEWKSQKTNFGTEFFYDEEGRISGLIKYGIIQ